MCGIIGFNWEDEQLITQLTDIISHRGPDDLGIFTAPGVSLGHRRLSIIDLSMAGHQPMTRKGLTIVFNGEIYNYKQIREQLFEYKFISESDTEVILYAYDKWGPGCLEKFNGIFAFCIYDKKKSQLFLARDRFGIKPVYYFAKGNQFAFSSEIKALLRLIDKKEIDEHGLVQFFNFRFTLGNTTLVKSIKKLLPGHHMVVDMKHNSIKEVQYYDIQKQQISRKPFAYFKRETRVMMERSIAMRMVSDVPVATLLSGGIDSTIITAIAKRYNSNLNTFSIGFDTTNELPFARLVAKKLNTNHFEFNISKHNVMDYLEDMVYHMDEPIGDPGFLPIFVLSKEVAKHNKVVLSGDGGDEVFCGYDRYKMFHYGYPLRHLALYDFGNDVLKRFRNMRGKTGAGAFFEVIRLFDDKELKQLGIMRSDGSEFWSNKYKKELLNAQEFDIKTLLPGDFFMKADKMSSAFGLEQRVPFLDHELVEFAFSIPLKYKLKGWNEKHVLKEAFRGKVPQQVVQRRKHGFDVPIDFWFKNVLGDLLTRLVQESSHGLYRKPLVLFLLKKIKGYGANYKLNFLLAQKLWSLLMLEMWYKRFME